MKNKICIDEIIASNSPLRELSISEWLQINQSHSSLLKTTQSIFSNIHKQNKTKIKK